jgi:hypothetical protein
MQSQIGCRLLQICNWSTRLWTETNRAVVVTLGSRGVAPGTWLKTTSTYSKSKILGANPTVTQSPGWHKSESHSAGREAKLLLCYFSSAIRGCKVCLLLLSAQAAHRPQSRGHIGKQVFLEEFCSTEPRRRRTTSWQLNRCEEFVAAVVAGSDTF